MNRNASNRPTALTASDRRRMASPMRAPAKRLPLWVGVVLTLVTAASAYALVSSVAGVLA